MVDSGSSDWLTTVLPFITLVLGAVLTYGFTMLAERRRTTREDKQRWHGDIKSTTASLLELATRFRDLAQTNDFLEKRAERLGADDSKDMLKRLLDYTDTLRKLQLKNTELNLIASERVSQQSVEFVTAIVQSTDMELSEEDRASAMAITRIQEQRLIKAVRAELALPVG